MDTIRNRRHRCWQLDGTLRALVLSGGGAGGAFGAGALVGLSRGVSAEQKVECPLRDLSFTAGDGQ